MDGASHAFATAHELYARSGGSTASAGRPPVYKAIGLVLAICSGLFIGVSFVLKKVGLLKANVKYNEEAGEGYGYLKNAYWWGGMTLMIIGEICNFVAYGFVDAILVTPLGALAVVITTILSAIFLKERLSFVGKVGCFNCIVGSVVIVINAPTQSAVATIQDMKHLVIAPGFLSYAGVVIIASAVVAFWLGPKYGKKTMMVYLSICSAVGGLSVVATQGLGAAIISAIGGTSGQFTEWFFYVLLVFVICTLLTEIIYLNKALNLFNAALVTPTYYVFFTSATIVSSAILFRGFKGTAATISTVIMGFLQICAGVVLLQLSKSAKDVPDAAVFNGDLDQVRTVAEQEEPEYEPRADSIRGGGAIIRSLSKARTEKQALEAKRIAEEHMEPIGENEQVEWDGLRRRKTVLDPDRPGTGSISRRKTVHPPLGMSKFPEPDETSDDDDIHPGFFQRLRSRGRSTRGHSPIPPSPVGLNQLPSREVPASASSGAPSTHIYGLPAALRKDMEGNTSYQPHDSHIQWAPTATGSASPHSRDRSQSSLPPPRPPPHSTIRQFSFQNVFHRHRSSSGAGEDGVTETSRPVSRGSVKKAGLAGATEEERMGLVKGDSQNLLTVPSHSSTLPEYSDDEWQMPSREVSPAAVGLSSPSSGSAVNVSPQTGLPPYPGQQEDTVVDEKDSEKHGRGDPRAFI